MPYKKINACRYRIRKWCTNSETLSTVDKNNTLTMRFRKDFHELVIGIWAITEMP